MSGYLTRVAMRAQSAHRGAEVAPLVRSTSPVVDHDQRLGVEGFEGVEPTFVPGDEREPMLPESINPRDRQSVERIPERGDPQRTQDGARGREPRRTLHSIAATAGPPPRGMENVDHLQAELRPSGHPTDRTPMSRPRQGDVIAPERHVATPPPGNHSVTSVAAGYEAPESQEVPDRHAASPDPPSLSESGLEGDVSALPGQPPSSDLVTGRVKARPAHSQGRVTTVPVGRERLRRRSLRERDQANASDAEPAEKNGLAQGVDLPDEEAVSTSSQGTRIVIGRMTVEVVPSPPTETRPIPTRPGPRTAASASVIGPLTRHVPHGRYPSMRTR